MPHERAPPPPSAGPGAWAEAEAVAVGAGGERALGRLRILHGVSGN